MVRVASLRLVEDSEGLRLSLRDVQGVAAGVPSRVLVITQEDDAGTGFKLGVTRVCSSVGWRIRQVVKV